ncbi:MAG: hypothetical protein ACT4P3_17205 [Betaproteobacteria bacterium]
MRKLVAAVLLGCSGELFSQEQDREEFAGLDLDGDGKVSLAEAAGFPAVVLRFDRADRDKDGKLTLAEFNRLKKLRMPVNDKARKAIADCNAGVGASGRR